jgi:hypothetical protein
MRLASLLKRNRHGVLYLRWVIPSAQLGGRICRGSETAVSLHTTRLSLHLLQVLALGKSFFARRRVVC